MKPDGLMRTRPVAIGVWLTKLRMVDGQAVDEV
jgi:hypothetical protein